MLRDREVRGSAAAAGGLHLATRVLATPASDAPSHYEDKWRRRADRYRGLPFVRAEVQSAKQLLENAEVSTQRCAILGVGNFVKNWKALTPGRIDHFSTRTL